MSALLLGAGPVRQGDPPAGVRTFEIQGATHVSPQSGQQVEAVPGIVTAVRTNGFTIQDAAGDSRPETSDAVFVFSRTTPTVAIGDEVRVSGQVTEFRPTNDENNLSVTEIVLTAVSVVAREQPLPEPVLLGPGGRTVPARMVAGDMAGDAEAFGQFAPDQSALDFFESLEGMRVQIADAVAVGPRGGRGELPVLPANGDGITRRTLRGGLLAAPPGDAPPSIVLADGSIRTPPASVGDRFPGRTIGTLEYAFGGYHLRVDELPSLILVGREPERANAAAAPPQPDTLSVATFNVENVSPRERPAKLARLAEAIVEGLGAPDLLALQELQDESGAADDGVVTATRTARALTDAILAAGGPAYEYRDIPPENNQDGGEPGANIRVGLLFRTDRGLALVDRPGGDAATPVSLAQDGDEHGPHLAVSPGRLVPDNPAWLESRKPLVAEFTFNEQRLFVIGCHFASRRGRQPLFGRFQPPASPTDAQRVEQARLVNAFALELLAADPAARLIVLGDLNDAPGSPTLATLTGGLLTDLLDRLPEADRYTYSFGGQAEAVDHILVSPGLLADALTPDIVHGNAEIIGAPSDHEPVVARFRLVRR